MKFFLLDPECAGELGENSVVDHSGDRPVVTRLHHDFFGWFGDDLLETTPCFIITERLAEALKKTGLQGAEFRDVEVSRNYEFDEFFPDVVLPPFVWLYVFGKPGQDDFGRAPDDSLVVSEKILKVLKHFNMEQCEVSEYSPE